MELCSAGTYTDYKVTRDKIFANIVSSLVNLAVAPPAVKYRESHMPFVQMENISHFLRACQMPPLSLPPHDVFLTVDLYEAKDPAQVLQCLGAFSRRAHAIQPGKFPRAIGKSKADALSPQISGSSQGARIGTPPFSRTRGVSNASLSGRVSPTKGSPSSPRTVSAWSNKTEESTTMPAWNIHQYGYMGGANQSNMGVAFGARRQITTPSPAVPSLAEKERRRREAAAEEERRRAEAEEAECQRRLEREAEEARAKAEEERLWEEETRKARENERRLVEEEKRRWDDEKRRWEEEDRQRQQEEREAEERLEQERLRKRELADARLNGQFLSQYQAGQRPRATSPVSNPESERIKALERELELAKERERQYERERQELARARGEIQAGPEQDRARSRSRPRPTPVKPSYDLASMEKERQMLRSEWQSHQDAAPKEEEPTPPSLPPRSLPEPPPKPPRPLPNPTPSIPQSRTDRFLATNPAPSAPNPTAHRPADYSSTAEIDAENARRVASTQKTRAGGWASKSLLEREMERERERQREWEEGQKRTKEAAARGVNTAGTGPGEGGWDVNQYGFMGGDNQNRIGTGIGFGARRQIIGPRPPP